MLALLACIAFGAVAAPELVWTFQAQSNLYAPPLVADLCVNPGLETVISDSDVRILRCIDSQGRQIWEYDGRFKKRLTSSAALSLTARAGLGTLAIGNSDGTLACIDGATGAELWRKPLGTMEWGGALWADLTGDGRDELIAGTEGAGICALDAAGNEIWRYSGRDGEKLAIRCPLAAADVDADGRAEIFGNDRFGPLCVGPDGVLRWRTYLGDDFNSSPVIAEPRGDGRPVLYCASSDADALWAIDARTGDVWENAALGGDTGSYPGSSIAVGDLDLDGEAEVVVATSNGYVNCVDASARPEWVFVTRGRTYAAATLGDIDGDGEVEVLAASGDRNLYCLDRRGVEEWRFIADLRLIHPPTIADVNNDGKTDLLLCGSDRQLRCLTLGGEYAPSRIPWGARRFDAAQSGASFGKVQPATRVTEERPLLVNGNFEQLRELGDEKGYPPAQATTAPHSPSGLYDRCANQPYGWMMRRPAGGVCALEREKPYEGAASLRVNNVGKYAEAGSDPIELAPGLRAVKVKVALMPVGLRDAGVRVSWLGLAGLIRNDLVYDVALKIDEWNVIEKELQPPQGARWLEVGCYVHDGRAALFDAVEVAGVYEVPRTVQAYVNQVGYDVGAPKLFNAASNFVAKEAAFELVGEDGAVAFHGPLAHEGRIVGAYGNDWGSEYWRGDFSAFDTPGKYRIRVMLDGLAGQSWPFEIGARLIFSKTARPAYRFFYYQRCGIEIPGFHKACHLDDSVGPDGKQYDLRGGWHDAGDYNKYHNAPYVLGLARAYAMGREAFDAQDEDGNGVSDFLDEILWGGEHLLRMMAPDGSAYGPITSGYGFWAAPELETDNLPATGDERPMAPLSTDSSQHTAALAKIARLLNSGTPPGRCGTCPFFVHTAEASGEASGTPPGSCGWCPAYVEAAERGLAWALERNMRGPLQFSAAVDLYAATRNEKHSALAKELIATATAEVLESVLLYDSLFGANAAAAMKDALVKRADEILALAQNPFGVYTFGPAERPNFFGTPAGGNNQWRVGTSSHILEAAHTVAKAYKFQPDPRYQRFIYDQINWTLGNNPYGVSLMEGVGSRFLPSYHHRYAFSGVPRGAVPGSVVNGVTWIAAGDDRPYLDMRGLDIPDFQSNEVWLPHNTAYLGVQAWSAEP